MSVYNDDSLIMGQIAVYKTDKKLVEFIDQLNAAPIQDYAAVHAGTVRPTQTAEGKRIYSNIGIVVQNYGNKENGKSIRAKANISPEEALFIALKCQSFVPMFDFKTMKIYGEPDGAGYALVTHLHIVRHPDVGTDGEARRYPWEISVENGKGKKGYNKQGGTYCVSGSYVKEKQVSIYLSELDFFKMTCALLRFITQWENAHAPKLIREGRLAREASWAAYAKSQRNG